MTKYEVLYCSIFVVVESLIIWLAAISSNMLFSSMIKLVTK